MGTTERKFRLEDMFQAPYPSQDDKSLQHELSNRLEFARLVSTPTEPVPRPGELYKHQEIIRRILLIYDRLLLIHEAGTGKTCSVVAPSEIYQNMAEFLEETVNVLTLAQMPIRRTIILVSGPTLRSEFKRQIACHCTVNKYFTEETAKLSEIGQRQSVTKAINKWYQILTYQTFHSQSYRLSEKELEEMYSDTLFYVDEVHNISFQPTKSGIKRRNKPEEAITEKLMRSIYSHIHKLFHLVKRSKIVLGSATPMISRTNELIPILNLILPLSHQIDLNTDFDTIEFEHLEPFLRGRISFVRALNTGAVPIYHGDKINFQTSFTNDMQRWTRTEKLVEKTEGSYRGDISEEGEEELEEEIKETGAIKEEINQVFETKIVACLMSDFQTEIYQRQIADTSRFFLNARKASTFVLPNRKIVDKPDQQYVTIMNDPDHWSPTRTLKDDIISDPGKLSAKFHKTFDICVNNPGSCYCYTDWAKELGAVMLGTYFEALGASRFIESRSVFEETTSIIKRQTEEELEDLSQQELSAEEMSSGNYCGGKSVRRFKPDFYKRHLKLSSINGVKLVYAIITSKTSPGRQHAILELFNSYENRHGEYIKALFVSKIGGEGINLANVQNIIVVNALWDTSKAYQAIMRGVRATAHVVLLDEKINEITEQKIENERMKNVDEGVIQQKIQDGYFDKMARLEARIDINIYQLVAVTKDGEGIEAMIYVRAEYKDRRIRRIMRMMKRSAIDCVLNHRRNVRREDTDGSFVCDYEKCQYICSGGGDPIDPIDAKLSSIDPVDLVEPLRNWLVKRLETEFSVSIDDILQVFPEYNDVRLIPVVESAIDQVVKLEKIITNMYGYPCHVNVEDNHVFLTRDKGDYLLLEYMENNYSRDVTPLSHYVEKIEISKFDVQEHLNDTKEQLEMLNSNELVMLFEYIYIHREHQVTNRLLKGLQHLYFKLPEPAEEISKAVQLKGKRVKKFVPGTILMSTFRGESPLIFEETDDDVVIHVINILSLFGELSSGRYDAMDRLFKLNTEIRILKPPYNQWGNMTQSEFEVYNHILRKMFYDKTLRNYDQYFPIYGIMTKDDFRFFDRRDEDEGKAKTQKRGRVCKQFGTSGVLEIMSYLHTTLVPFMKVDSDPKLLHELRKDIVQGINNRVINIDNLYYFGLLTSQMTRTLVITTTSKCMACNEFKTKHLENLRSAILTEFKNSIQIIELELYDIHSDIPDKYPTDHDRYIGWVPTFSLYENDFWESAMQSEETRMTYQMCGEVFNGSFNKNGIMTLDSPLKTLTSSSILDWITNVISTSEHPTFEDKTNYNVRMIKSRSALSQRKFTTTLLDSMTLEQMEFVEKITENPYQLGNLCDILFEYFEEMNLVIKLVDFNQK